MNTYEAAEKLVEILRKEKCAVILLHGDMGAGKTTFVSQVIKMMIPNAQITSPTFTLINQYSDNIFHADLYRIKDESELYNIGFHEILNGNNIFFVEWPFNNVRNVTYSISSKVINVYIEVINETERKISFN